MRKGKHEHRNKLVFLSDELLRQDSVNRDEYTQLNDMLTESLESEKGIESSENEVESTTVEDETREGKLENLVRSTTDHLIEHDKKELLELINEFRKDVGEYFLDSAQ